jgi:transposase
MEDPNTVFIGLDVHKDSIAVAVAEGGARGEVRPYGTIGGDLNSVEKLARKFQGTGKQLRFVYEAGPCGYEIYRYLTAKGIDCMVVAPSMVPKRSTDRIKTDRRDAVSLARLHRAGELSSVYVPCKQDEAIRDLSRAREDAKGAERRARHQLKALLLRNGIRYQGKTSWTPAHVRWLSGIKMPMTAQRIVFEEYLNAVSTATERVDRLTRALGEEVQRWRMRPVVDAFQALRGVQFVVAATVVSEVGDISRFNNPRELMAYLGLVPSEHSSGGKRHQGSITKCGNSHARRILIEAAWQYQLPARISRVIRLRQEKLTQRINQIAWKAQLRLCGRFRRLRSRRMPSNKVVVAVARELVGFMWAIAKEVKVA